MAWLPSCGLLEVAFALMLACVVLGYGIAQLAWRHRRADLPWSQWAYDPTYLFRSSYYTRPYHWARWTAIGLQVVGLVLLLLLATTVMRLQATGATMVCGLAL